MSGGGKPPTDVRARWVEGQAFDVQRPNGPTIRIDGDGKSGTSPVATLLGALATCAGIDVMLILAKRKTPVTSLDVEVVGDRADAVPSRVTSVTMHFRIGGAGIEQVHAERAVELSVTKYCSVRDTLDPKLPIAWKVTLEGGGG